MHQHEVEGSRFTCPVLVSLHLISRLTLEVWQRDLSERDATSSIVSYASDFSPLNLWHPLWFEMEDTSPFE